MKGMDMPPIVVVASLILLVFAALVAALVLVVRTDLRNTRTRAAAFQKAAGEMGFAFHPQGVNGYLGDLSKFDLFQCGRTRWFRNVLYGRVRGVEVCVFDYQYTTGSDARPQCWHQTAVGFRAPDLALPDFALRLRSWGDRFGPGMPALTREVQAGYREIAFEASAAFSRHYRLSAIDEAEVRRLFAGGPLDFFADRPALNVEAHGDRLLVYRDAVPASPEGARGLVEAGFEVLAGLRAKG